MAGGKDDGEAYSSSWSLILPGGQRFSIGLIPSMAVENAYRDWARAAIEEAKAKGSQADSGKSASANDAVRQSMHSFFLPLSPQQAAQLRLSALENDTSVQATSDASLDAARHFTASLPGMIVTKLMVDYSTGESQLLLPAELVRVGDGTSGSGGAADASAPPSLDALNKSSGFVFLGDGAPLTLQRDGITVGRNSLPSDVAALDVSATPGQSPQPSSDPATAPPVPSTNASTTAATTSALRSGRGRQKVLWSWEGAGRLHPYTNAVSRRIEEGYINYLCSKRDEEEKVRQQKVDAGADGSGSTTATAADPAVAVAVAADPAATAAAAAASPATAVTHTSTVNVRSVAYVMDYVAMTQRNIATGRTRVIKREGPAPLLPVSVRDTTTTAAKAPDTATAAGTASAQAAAPAPPAQTAKDLAKKLLPGKWQFMRARGRKWFNFDDTDNKGVEDAYQNFIVQFRTTANTPDLSNTLSDPTASTANAKAVTASANAKSTPATTARRSDIISTHFHFTGADKCAMVLNEHKEPFEAFLEETNHERVTLIRLLYSSETSQFVLAVATWEILGSSVTQNAASLPGKGSGQVQETLTELGANGTTAAEAFTERLTEAMCEVAALSGGVSNSTTARRLMPNRGFVKGVTCGTENFTYTFDFIRMTQTNEQTNTTRRIRRLTSGMPGFDGHYTAKPPLSTAAAAAAAAASSPSSPASGATTSTKPVPVAETAATKTTALKLPLDKHIPGANNKWEPVEVDGVFYYCMLNQANVTSNANKFYCIQLLRDADTNKYSTYTRFGRVGDVGTPGFLCTQSSLDWAVSKFEEQFKKKTHCEWEKRDSAKPKSGRYAYMKIDLTATDKKDDDDGSSNKTDSKVSDFNPMTPANAPPSKLHPLVKDLMDYISDRSDMRNTMERDFSLDVKRMPLGHITKEQIKDALTVLSQIDDVLRNPLEMNAQKKLTDLTNAFYTLVPHRVSKMERLPIIGDARALHKKVQLMQNLGDLEIAADLLKKVEDAGKTMVEHPLDTMYRQLQCQITPLDDSDPVVQRIRHYVEQTRGKTHYNVPEVEQVFAVDRVGEDARYEAMLAEHKGKPGAPDTNRVMLWHGSRKTNYLGILSKGLRIAPPEAPSTGYMFGKGIYFSDVVTKASNYCFSNNKKGIILLNEVALGKCYELGKSEFMLKPHAGTFSTNGVGGSAPDPSGSQTIDGVVWPMGKTHEIKHPRITKTSLLYPEFIIYNEAQYRMRYLLRIRFK